MSGHEHHEHHHGHHGHGQATTSPAPKPAGADAAAVADDPKAIQALRSEIPNPTFKQVSDILWRLGACMAESGLNFRDETTVRASWDIIMDAAIPFDGRRQLYKEDAATGAYWLLRNQPSSMPYQPDLAAVPDYGQFTDAELRTLNDWGEQQGLTSFREAINTCGPVKPGGVLAPGARVTKLIRYDVDVVWKNPIFLSQVLDAFRVLQDPKAFPRVNKLDAYKMYDLGEWGDLVSIHGGPWQYYRNDKSGLAMWCWHRNFQFLPWHRPWLAAVEGALAAAQTSLGYANPIGLPYWDQTKPYTDAQGRPSYRNGHPIFFTESYISVVDGKTYPNPLHPKNAKSLFSLDGTPLTGKPPRRIIRGWPEELLKKSDNNPDSVQKYYGGKSWDEIAKEWDDEKNYFDFSALKWPTAQSPDTLVQWMRKHLAMAPDQPIFYAKTGNPADYVRLGVAQWIETVHNQIHNWIGLDCQDAAIAGFDPILYFFHSNIDRQLQTVIDQHGDGIFAWLSQTPDGIPDHVNDLTVLHMPVPFPPELHNTLRRRLGKFELPKYKQCFQLDYFNYIYKEPYVFPTLEEAQLDAKRTAWVAVAYEQHLMSKSRIVVSSGGKVLGATDTLGMSMRGGRMRALHSPAFLDPILVELDLRSPKTDALDHTITVQQPSGPADPHGVHAHHVMAPLKGTLFLGSPSASARPKQ